MATIQKKLSRSSSSVESHKLKIQYDLGFAQA